MPAEIGCSMQSIYVNVLFVLVQQVSHGAVQFMVYEELRKFVVDLKSNGSKKNLGTDVKVLVSLVFFDSCQITHPVSEGRLFFYLLI